jgi:hypothetical protein
MADLSRLSEKDLELISAGRMQEVSESGLRILAGKEPIAQRALTAVDTALGLQPTPPGQKPQYRLLEEARQAKAQPLAVTDTDVGRQLGLTARAGATGVLGLPALASDAIVSLVNMIGGTSLPMPSQAQQQLMTRAGLPEAETEQEKRAQDVSSAIAGVLGGAGIGAALPARFAASRELLTQSPVFQATSAGAGALGSALAREEGMGPYEQLGLGVLAGTVAPSAGTAAVLSAQSAARGGRELVRPFTEAGREVVVGNILRQLSRDPDAAVRNLEAYQAGVPGYTPTTAQAARDVGLAAAVPPVRGLDVTGKLTEQSMQANRARLAILDRLAKEKTDLDAAIAKRDEVTRPLREQAFERSTVTPEQFFDNIANVDGLISNILSSPAGKRVPVERAMKFARDRISQATTPQELYEVRKDLRDAAQGLLDKDGSAYRLAKGQLEQVIRSIDEQIESVAPGYADYLKKYAASSRGIERMEAAQEFRGKVLTTTPMISDPGNVSEYLISQPKFVNAIRAAENETKLSKTQLAVLKKVGQDLDDATTRVTQEPGSNTFRNLSVANVMGAIAGKSMFGDVPAVLQKVAAPMNWLYNGTDDQIREVIVDAMLDPKLAARLMRKATTAEMVPLSQELQKRALKLGYGQVFGLTEE